MTTVKVNSRNQIVIPKQAREHLGVAPGDELLVIERRDGMLLVASISRKSGGRGDRDLAARRLLHRNLDAGR